MEKFCLACRNTSEPSHDFCAPCSESLAGLAYPRTCYHGKSPIIVSHLYSDPISKLIKRAKSQPFGLWDERLRAFFDRRIEHWIPILSAVDFDIIVSVPGHAIRCELETDLAAYMSVKISRALKKPIVTEPLIRRRILDRDLFLLNKNPSMLERLTWRPLTFERTRVARPKAAKKVLLVDDVMSSGSTLETCKKLLGLQGNTVSASFVLAATSFSGKRPGF